ncbi:MAG: SDR family oxidoreductase [Chitinophagaceae bacterium]
MKIQLNSKTALVCGSTQGIGKAIAMQFAACGASVILMARNEEKLKACLQELPNNGNQNHSYLVADFSDNNSVRAAAKQLPFVSILVNNTGGPPAGQAIDANPEAYLSAFSSHLINNQILVQAVVERMKSSVSGGRIINIISTSVKVPLKNLGVSNTIRGAVGNWSKTLANELAPFNITVNNILPGATETERLGAIIDTKSRNQGLNKSDVTLEMLEEIPMNRFGKPEEPAYAAAFLASEYAAYITGTNIVVDGGRTPCL